MAFLMSSCVNASLDDMPLDQSYCSLIKETINLDELQQYYHIDVFPERSPLIVVVAEKGFNCIDLVKFDKPVTVTDKRSTPDEVYLEITKIDVTHSTAFISFRYAPEGIRGEIKFKKIDSRWAISTNTIVEW